nr:copia LTR rider [Tanacetum cinerariifolium]
MTRAKFDIEKLDGTGDFRLWRIKMRALLIQHGCEAFLEALPMDMKTQAKAELNKKLTNNHKKLTGYVKKDDKPSSSGTTYENSEVMMVMSVEALLDWIMNLGCSNYMTPMKAHYSGSDRLCSFRLMGSFSGGIIRRFKHEAFSKFKEWKQLVENQTGKTIKKLRTDNGLEFCNRKTLIDEVTSTAIEKKTHMEMWSGHASDYGMLMTFGYVAYSHVKQVTSRNVVFNESVMYKDTLKDYGAGIDKSVEELQVEVELQRLNNHTLEEDQTDQEDGDDEDAGDQEIGQILDLTDYQLVQDREPRTRMKPLRDGFSEEEQDLGVSGSSSWAKADELAAIDYNEVFSLVYKLEQLDVKTIFLHGNLKEVIYIRHPLGYEQVNKEFDMKELREANKILSMEIVRDWSRKILRVSQSGAICKCSWELNVLDGVHEARHSVCDRGNHMDVTGFVDSEYANDPDKEEEYMSLTEVVKEAIWLRGLLEVLEAKTVNVLKVDTKHNTADALKKV